MKLTTFILLVFTLHISASGLSQNVTLAVKNMSVQKVLKQISRQTGVSIIYNESYFDETDRVTLQVDHMPIEDVLKLCLEGNDYSPVIDNGMILIRKNKESQPAQEDKKVKGKVTDNENKPLPGATITVVGTTRGVITDNDGTYSIEAGPRDKLVFSFIGMESQIIDISNRQVIDVTLKEKSEETEDVTIVAFGKQKKESVIGSITTVKPAELKVPSSNLTTALSGRVAGIISYQRSGEPGQDNADFFVRGITTFGTNTNPLILIDGIELSSADLARLQPDDIASFSIMKDATATALYGARGANGVILVTTKQGVEGPAKISVRLENSFSMPTTDIEFADPVTYMKLQNEAILTRDPGGTLLYSQEKIENTEAGMNPVIYPANDWKKMLFRNFTTNQRANLSVNGGGGVARYYVAAAFNRDNGILKVDKRNNFNNNIAINNYTLRANVNIDIFKATELIVRLHGNFEDYSGPISGGAEMYRLMVHSNPVLFPAYFPIDEEHKHVKHIMFGNYENSYTNPYAEMVKGYKDKSRSQMLAQVELKQDLSALTKGLSVRGMMNITRLAQFSVTRAYTPFFYQIGSYDRQTGAYALTQTTVGTEYLGYSEVDNDRVMNSTFYFEGMANYNRDFADKHSVSGLLVFMTRQSMDANAGSLQLSLPSRNLGLSGRMTYSYDHRYFAEFNFGYNGSERFDAEHRFGFFPSAGVAWSISSENFWKPLKPVVSNLKLRYSYGLVGNDQIGSNQDRFYYLSEVNMSDANKRATFGQDLNNTINGVTVSRYANSAITWETSTKQNFAMEIGLWDDISIIAEYFTEHRKNILMTRDAVPRTMGLSALVRSNVGEASGSGVDLSLEYQKNWTNDFWTSIRGNFTYATSKYEVYEEPQYDEPWRTRVGRSLRQEYGYLAERLFVDDIEAQNSPVQEVGTDLYGGGDLKYTDVNRDGKVDDADRVPIGNPTVPEMVYGFGFSLGYKGVDFSAFFQGTANESFWINAAATSPFNENAQLLKVYADSYWSEENRDIYATWPRLSPTINSNNVPGAVKRSGNWQWDTKNTWFMRDGSFLRLKQVELGYTFPRVWTEKMHMSNLRFYVSGTNLLLFSKFKLWDVEMAGEGLGYPIQKVFNMGLTISLN
ncbi:MAG: TonB-dependent receptor [Prolixibacteraceae bacterium]